MDPTKPSVRHVVTNCLDPRVVSSFRTEQKQEPIHLKSNHEHHHSSHHRSRAGCRPRRPFRENEGTAVFYDDSGGERRKDQSEGNFRNCSLIGSPSALLHNSSGGRAVSTAESVNNTSENQSKEGKEVSKRRRRGSSERTARPHGEKLRSPASGEENVDSDDRSESGAIENTIEEGRGVRVTLLKYRKPLLVVVLLLLVFGTVQLISGKEQTNQPLLFHRGVFSKKRWSRWALPPFFLNSQRNSTSMQSFNRRQFARLTLSSMWRKPVAAFNRCFRSSNSLNPTLLRPLLQGVRQGQLFAQFVITRSYQWVQFVVQACLACVRNLAFLTKKNRVLFFNESARRGKQCVILNTSSIADIVSNNESNDCNVFVENLANGEKKFFLTNTSSSTYRETLYSESWLHKGIYSCYSMLRSLQAKWRSFAWRMIGSMIQCSNHVLTTWKQWVMQGVGTLRDRFFLLFRALPAFSSPASATFSPLTESSTGKSRSNRENKSRSVKWWRWRKTEHLSFASPLRRMRHPLKTVSHYVRTRLWWCQSKVLFVWRTISLSVQQKLFSFWNIIKIRQGLVITMKKKQRFQQNPKRYSNETNISSGTLLFPNSSVASRDAHTLHSQRMNKHVSAVPSQLFYFVELKGLQDPQANEEKDSMTRKVVNSDCPALSLPESSWVQQEIVRDLSLPSASFIKNLTTEVGIFIHFSRPGISPFPYAAKTEKGSHTAMELPSRAQDPEDYCSAFPFPSLPHPLPSAAPSLFYRLRSPKRLVEVLRARKEVHGVVKPGANKRERVSTHPQKEEIKVPGAGTLGCPSHKDETRWREERTAVIAASAKCESELEVLLQEKETLLQERVQCTKKTNGSVEAALLLEADEHVEHLRVTLTQQCNARLKALNASFQAALNKTNVELCDARRTQSTDVGRWMQNVALNDTSVGPIKQTEAPSRSVHLPEKETRKWLSAFESLLHHFDARSFLSLPSNNSIQERVAGAPTTVFLESAVSDVMLGVQQAIENRCSAACLTAAETSSGNSKQKPPHVLPPQCAEEATALHLRLTAQLENILAPSYFSPLRKTSSSSWSQVASTLLLPTSLGNFCTLIWSGNIEDHHKMKQDVENHENLSVLCATSTRWYHSFSQHVRKMFFRVLWLTVAVGALCLARGLYFLLEDNARLRCELQQATITAIQERMMHMEGMDDAQYSPPQWRGDGQRKLSQILEAEPASKVDCVTSSSGRTDKGKKPVSFSEWNDAMRTSFLYLSSWLEILYSSLSESHFHHCELLWLMENEAPSEKVLHHLPPVKKKCVSECSGGVLKGKSLLSPSQASVGPLTVSPENELLCGAKEAKEADTHLLEALLKGYFQAIEEHYLDLLHASFPLAFENRNDFVTEAVNIPMDDSVSGDVLSCMTRRSKTPEKESIKGGSGSGDNNADDFQNSDSSTACRRPSKVEWTRNKHRSDPQPSFCCLKWKLEAENAKNLMEMQAQTIRQLEEQLTEQLEAPHLLPSTTTSVKQ